ncbi:hypothetical protein M434DRAFT_402482 [Hypoxylon sp. CO27-5]|nr:hypothetical protein M434DRAFT_402482 [Hypoxylon sp. CO27-5]
MDVHRSIKRLEAIVEDQKAEIYRLEDLVCRTMHRNRVDQDTECLTSPHSTKGSVPILHEEESNLKGRKSRLSAT